LHQDIGKLLLLLLQLPVQTYGQCAHLTPTIRNTVLLVNCFIDKR